MLKFGPKYEKLKTSLQLAVNRSKILQAKTLENAEKLKKETAVHLINDEYRKSIVKAHKVLRETAKAEVLEIIELFCKEILERFDLLREKSGPDASIQALVVSLVWVSPFYQSHIQELKKISKQLTAKYGNRFRRDALRNKWGHVDATLMEKVHFFATTEEELEKCISGVCRKYGINSTKVALAMQAKAGWITVENESKFQTKEYRSEYVAESSSLSSLESSQKLGGKHDGFKDSRVSGSLKENSAASICSFKNIPRSSEALKARDSGSRSIYPSDELAKNDRVRSKREKQPAYGGESEQGSGKIRINASNGSISNENVANNWVSDVCSKRSQTHLVGPGGCSLGQNHQCPEMTSQRISSYVCDGLASYDSSVLIHTLSNSPKLNQISQSSSRSNERFRPAEREDEKSKGLNANPTCFQSQMLLNAPKPNQVSRSSSRSNECFRPAEGKDEKPNGWNTNPNCFQSQMLLNAPKPIQVSRSSSNSSECFRPVEDNKNEEYREWNVNPSDKQSQMLINSLKHSCPDRSLSSTSLDNVCPAGAKCWQIDDESSKQWAAYLISNAHSQMIENTCINMYSDPPPTYSEATGKVERCTEFEEYQMPTCPQEEPSE